MNFQKKIIYTFLCLSVSVFGQEKIKHKVVSGESVYSIAQKYNVKQSAIIELNPKAKKTLQLNMLLEIPISRVKEKDSQVEIVEHEVLTKETLYSLSKKYKTTIEKIKEINPSIESQGLKIGEHIKIPTEKENWANLTEEKPKKNKKRKKEETTMMQEQAAAPSELNNNRIEVIHEVQVKETKYGISKKYGMTITELETLNPHIKNSLAIGDKLLIKTKSIPENVAISVEPKSQNAIKDAVTTKEKEIQKGEKEVEVAKQVEKIMPTSPKKGQIKIVEIKPQIEEENTDELIIESEAVQPEMPITVVAPLSEENMSKAEFLITKASENIGARYRSGSTGNGGFDCSGLMFATFKNIEMTLPRSSREMAQRAGVRIDRDQAQKGDLIFFATRGRGVGHVGMVTDVIEDEIKFIHSSTSQGVIISSTKEPYYAKRFVQINRVLLDE
ncbi:Murein DD-endopeptidase MepS/Murein LD-carboxypeptidase precursor [Flavobacterium columnare]|uniref:LysM peptidoglycan-binding domain-containing protein n=3 Tax=Flavobacterium TaxID=237 RepID=A0ABW8PLZ7_9FLAO|nr:C40 family peptidase [Flavobacterium columnare]SPE77006.1 Murein DD-endopeptidase MepS/Murein LD-carboxypeptidase precursor [Flavobacterium columnare]